MALQIPLLALDPEAPFPAVAGALREPDGLLAIGGDLSPQRLLNAYRHGIFPWYSKGQPPLWWSPDPRAVFETDRVHLSRRFLRELVRSPLQVCMDHRFDAVIDACAHIPRRDPSGRQVVSTWIIDEMLDAYLHLHRLGFAHSVEVVDADGSLVGGLYGVALGRMFFAESMFSIRTGGSKIALAALAAVLRGWRWPLIDAQMTSAHLASLGARQMPRSTFVSNVGTLCAQAGRPGSWASLIEPFSAQRLATVPAVGA